MKKLLTLLFIGCYTLSNAQIITEIMYNPPEEGVDSLEYIEIYNNTNSDIDLSGFSLIGVNLTFDTIPTLEVDSFLVICKDSIAILNNFGVTAHEWNSGALSNTGEELGIINTDGDTLFHMTYSSMEPWPADANGLGPSIELCDYNNDATVATNWNLSQGFTNNIINIGRLTGTPGAPNDVACQIRDYTKIAITEVLYESPSWDTDLQYIELYNYGDEVVNLNNWSISGDITIINLPNVQLKPDHYYLIGNDPIGLLDYGIAMTGWDSTNVISLDPNLILINPDGIEVVALEIDEDTGFDNPEPGQALELCDPEMDNTIALNWAISSNEKNEGGNVIFGTPGENNTCTLIGTSASSNIGDDTPLSIYPNPSYDIINVKSDKTIDHIDLMTISGNLVSTNESTQIDVTPLVQGIYIIQIHFSNRDMSIRKVVIH